MDDVVESLSGDDFLCWGPPRPSSPSVDVSLSEDGVNGAVELGGDLTEEGSRDDMEGRRPSEGERIAGQRDLSVGRTLRC